MFKVDEYEIEFDYRLGDPVNEIITRCSIYKNGLVAWDAAVCSPDDQFNKNVGRKIALGRALKILTKDRKLRKRFWDAYFATRHGKY